MFYKIGIATNRKRDLDYSKTLRLAEIIRQYDSDVLFGDKEENLYAVSDLIITLGGDGTILSVAEPAANKGVPVLGINIGHMGYLTDCSFDMAEQSIKNLINGNFVSEKRMMLKVEIISEQSMQAQCCLNDICIARGATSKIIRFDLLINGSFVGNYNADGIIVSTPTGSTAYNLSAGGPVLIPNSEMIAITPICPHMLTSRPIVVSSCDKITIRIGETRKETIATLDGKEPVFLQNGGIVNIEKSKNYINILKTNGMNFYEVLRKKLLGINPVDF